MNTQSAAFPAPSSLRVLAGTERAQAAYPYYMQFTAADDARFWFYNSMHFPEPMSAFDMVTAEAAYCALGSSTTRVHCLPTTLGIDYRIINGRVYIGGNAVTDPAQIARRTGEFQQRAFYKKAFPEISDQTVARMVAGIEAEIFRPDEELRRLARRAVELGVDDEFKEGRTAQAVMAALEARGAAGRAWLGELATSRDPWFNINVGDGFYHYHRSWNDDLSMPFAGLPGYIARVKAGESLKRPIEKLQAQRRQLIQDYRDLLGSEEERQAYDQMIGLPHRGFPYVEGDNVYCEHWDTDLFFNKIREFGALLAAHGFFAREEDVFQLTHYEVEAAIIDLMTSWSNGSPPRGPEVMRSMIAASTS